MSAFTAYLHFNLGEVSFSARNNLKICCISTVAFLVNNSGGVFLLRVSGSARFFSCCPNYMYDWEFHYFS